MLRERITVLAWGIAALSFVALAASAVQMPGKFASQQALYSQITLPLPAPGPVTTTASIGSQTAQNAFQVYENTRGNESQQNLQNSKELHAVREEIISLRRSVLRLTEQNRRLSSHVKALDEAAAHKTSEAEIPAASVKTSVKPKQKPATPIETLPAPELLQASAPIITASPLPEIKLSEVGTLAAIALPKASNPETVASIPEKASALDLPEFQKTPAAGKLRQSGTRRILRTSFAIELGNFEDANSLESKWQRLREDNPLLLGNLKKRVSAAKVDDSTKYTLTAGPFYNAADTAVVCARLAREKVNCLPTIFQ
ncbi:SPOR domain-containing protein [Pseudovibrio sp. Alg231-02]|uniref:SPOR domain-containing protein n=1 Tax=Pseudovibrio sp. Alg231-02 TaxID=1922223 RepID=UPI001AD8D28F|nr:SPOR domain-containing protein [Pseudovibrio sp. Alg231-02]